MTVLTPTIDPQLAALAALESTISAVVSGVTYTIKGYADPPDTIEGNLPACINIPLASNDTWGMSDDAGAEANELRNWEVRLYVIERGSATLPEAFRRCKPFYDLMRDLFQAHQSLNRTRHVLQVTYLGDSGLQFNRMIYERVIYSGVIFRVRTLARVRTLYAADE